MCVLCNKTSSLLKCLTHSVVFCWYPDLISHTHMHKQTKTQHTQEQLMNWHTPIHTHSSYLYNIEWRIHWYHKSLLSTISFLFKNYSFVEVMYLMIRCSKTKFFLWNANNPDRNGAINKTHTYTLSAQRKITLEKVS